MASGVAAGNPGLDLPSLGAVRTSPQPARMGGRNVEPVTGTPSSTMISAKRVALTALVCIGLLFLLTPLGILSSIIFGIVIGFIFSLPPVVALVLKATNRLFRQ